MRIFEEKTIREKRVYDGRLLKIDSLDVVLPDGRKAVREVIRHPGAAVVLVRNSGGRFVFVRQYRKAAERVMLEVVAGTLEPGEDPVECARREVAEETGLTVVSIEPLGIVYPVPGYSSEKLHLYLAEAAEGLSGHKPDYDENIEAVVLDEGEIEGMLARGELDDAKTLCAWMFYRKSR